MRWNVCINSSLGVFCSGIIFQNVLLMKTTWNLIHKGYPSGKILELELMFWVNQKYLYLFVNVSLSVTPEKAMLRKRKKSSARNSKLKFWSGHLMWLELLRSQQVIRIWSYDFDKHGHRWTWICKHYRRPRVRYMSSSTSRASLEVFSDACHSWHSLAFVFSAYCVRWDIVSIFPLVQSGLSFEPLLKRVVRHILALAGSVFNLFHLFHGSFPPSESLFCLVYMFPSQHSRISWIWNHLRSRVLCGCSRIFTWFSVYLSFYSALKGSVCHLFLVSIFAFVCKLRETFACYDSR